MSFSRSKRHLAAIAVAWEEKQHKHSARRPGSLDDAVQRDVFNNAQLSHLHCILNWPCRSALWMDMSLRLMIIRSVCPALHRNHGLLNGSSAALVHLGQV